VPGTVTVTVAVLELALLYVAVPGPEIKLHVPVPAGAEAFNVATIPQTVVSLPALGDILWVVIDVIAVSRQPNPLSEIKLTGVTDVNNPLIKV
jgi:hypothetical protein